MPDALVEDAKLPLICALGQMPPLSYEKLLFEIGIFETVAVVVPHAEYEYVNVVIFDPAESTVNVIVRLWLVLPDQSPVMPVNAASETA